MASSRLSPLAHHSTQNSAQIPNLEAWHTKLTILQSRCCIYTYWYLQNYLNTHIALITHDIRKVSQ